MKIIISESQHKRLFKESFPDDVSLSIGNKVNKSIIKMFEWCHRNTPYKKKVPTDVAIDNMGHIIPTFAGEIRRKLALDKNSSLTLSYNFFIRYNDEGIYDNYLGEDLQFFGEFVWNGDINVTEQAYGVAEDSSIWVYARSHDDADFKITNNKYHDVEIGDVNVEGFDYNEWIPYDGIDTDKGETEYWN